MLPVIVFGLVAHGHVLADGKMDPLPGADAAIDLTDGLWKKYRHGLSLPSFRLGKVAALGAADPDNVATDDVVAVVLLR